MLSRPVADQASNQMSAGIVTPSVTSAPVAMERKFRRALWIASALAAVAILGCCFTMLRSQNELTPAESVVALHSSMLAHDGTLYYDLNRYPYTVCAYMPVFYLLEAAMVRAKIPAPMAGRLVSFLSLLGLITMCWRLVLLYTGDRLAAWVAAVLAASSSLLMFWGTIGQVDTLAVLLAVTAFYQYSRFHLLGESTLLLAGLFAGLAIFTKQTMVAVPAAIVVSLFMRDKKKALLFAVLFLAAAGGLVLAIDRALGGRFLSDTVVANMNPMDAAKFLLQLRYFGSVSGCLLLVTAVTVRRIVRRRGLPMVIYLGFAAIMFLLTAPKIASDTNYQIETTVLLAICAAIGLHELNFFSLVFRGSKNWVTLLMLPLAVHAAVGDRVAVNLVIARWATEDLFREQIRQLRPYVDPTAGRVISTDFNAMVRLRGKMEVEPLPHGWLVSDGLVNPEPVRRDLAAGAFATVILGDNVFESNAPASNLELGSLPPVEIEEIRKHYRLVAHIKGPYMDGLYVYQP
jgi:hypothetical protein